MALTPNLTILDGKYTIIRRLGRGAFAYVWLAEDHHVGQKVAIKELRHGELSRGEFVDLSRRFQREAKIGRALRHPNIVEVYTVEQWDQNLLLVMEYVEGETLAERLARQGPLELETALDVAVQLCDALDAVHEHALGIVHRDVKPSNVLLTERGQTKLLPKLTDFGLAQLAAESGRSVGRGGHHPGTPLYMAPEQETRFGYLAPAADIYALALTVGEMLTGRPVKPRLLRGDSWAAVLREEPRWLAEALEKATAEGWQERYRQAGELGAALREGWRGRAAEREAARQEVEEQQRQERLAGLYEEAQAALREQRWQEAIERCQATAAIDPGYRDVGGLRSQAEEGLRRERAAEEREKQRQAELERLYAAVQAALEAEQWEAAVQRCEEIQRLEPGYRDVVQVKARAQARLAKRQAERARQRQRQAAVSEESVTAAPRPKPFPWTPVLAAVAAVVVIVSTVWGIQSCNGQPTPQVIEKVVKETVLIEVQVTSTPAERPVEATAPLLRTTATPRPPTNTPRPPTATPRPPTNTPRPPTATPGEPAAGATRVWDKDGAVMVYVPAGEFIMGNPAGEGQDDEHPQHTVTLDGYWIDRMEVTNGQFAKFVEATGHRTTAEEEGCGWGWTGEEWKCIDGADWRHPNGPATSIDEQMDHPVVQVSWYGAVAYCQWAGKRLPTEAEWEKAARGSDGRTYPWGDAFDGRKLNFCDTNCEFDWKDDSADDGYARTAPVGSYPAGASPYGAQDMAGNAWEWVADWYDSEYYSESSATRNPTGPDSGDSRVLRGGSWLNFDFYARSANRCWNYPDYRDLDLGFRCCVSPTSSL